MFAFGRWLIEKDDRFAHFYVEIGDLFCYFLF